MQTAKLEIICLDQVDQAKLGNWFRLTLRILSPEILFKQNISGLRMRRIAWNRFPIKWIWWFIRLRHLFGD